MRWLTTLALVCLGTHCLPGQDLVVRFQTTKALLFMGYVNNMKIYITREDTVNQYIFHASASGADINYEADGTIWILPYQKYGSVDVYAEVNGTCYKAGQFKFEAVKPPPITDGIFVEAMGITKEDPKTRLAAKKKFDPSKFQIRSNPKISVGAFPFMDLRSDQLNVVKVSVLRRGPEYMVPQEGQIEVLSTDARVRKVDATTFNIEPLPGKHRCLLSVYLNGKKVSDERLGVYRRE